MRKSALLLVAMLGLAGYASADIPFFWLDKPKSRTNPNDPSSPLHILPTNTPSGPVFTNTPTDTYTYTNTYTPVNTPTNTYTNTPVPTPTNTPTPVLDSKDPGDDVYTGATSVSTGGSDTGHNIGSGSDTYDFFAVTFVDTHTYDIKVAITGGSGTITLENMGQSGGSVLGTWNGTSGNVIANLTSSGINGTVYFRVRATASMQYDFSFIDTTGATATNTSTNTPVPPTNTPTNTPVPPTNTPTDTPVPPTNTPTNTFTPSNTPTPGACPAACGTCIKYEDFEMPVAGPYGYQEFAGDAATFTTTTAEAHSCLQALAITMNNTGSNYVAAGFGSNYYVSNTVNATGANYLNLWVKAATACTFAVSFTEYWGSDTDPQNEGWTSSSQSYTATGTWQQFHIPLTAFTENIYSGLCSPNCLTTQNNMIDKDKIGAMDINFTTKPYTGMIYVDDVSFDTVAPTPTPTPASLPVTFNDFEDGLACGSYTYDDGASTLSQAPDSGAAYGGSASGWRINIDTTSGSFAWGAGCGTGGAGCATVDGTGLNNVSFQMFVTKTGGSATNIGYTISLKEENVAVVWPASDPSNENWQATGQSISTFGSWVKVTIPLGSFAEGMGNADCSPNCATQGDNVLNVNVMKNFDFNITSANFQGTVDIDDIKFE